MTVVISVYIYNVIYARVYLFFLWFLAIWLILSDLFGLYCTAMLTLPNLLIFCQGLYGIPTHLYLQYLIVCENKRDPNFMRDYFPALWLSLCLILWVWDLSFSINCFSLSTHRMLFYFKVLVIHRINDTINIA